MPLRHKRPLPGFGPSLGTTVLIVSIAVLVPLGALVFRAASLSWEQYWGYLSDPRALSTYRVTLSAAAIATALNIVQGLAVAWALERYEFPGRRFLDSLIDVPFALPTAVAGITLATLLSPSGHIGKFLAAHGFQIAYAFPGIVVAMSFTSLPFVVRSVQPIIADLDFESEECAHILGAGAFTTFWRVTLPALTPALIGGASLAFARSLGEFGAVVFISGNLPFKTEITALLAYIRMDEYDYTGASALASAILAFALLVLLAANLLQARLNRRLHP